MQLYDPETEKLNPKGVAHITKQNQHVEYRQAAFLGAFTAAALQACDNVSVTCDASTAANPHSNLEVGKPRLNILVTLEDGEYKLGTYVILTPQNIQAWSDHEVAQKAVDYALKAVQRVAWNLGFCKQHYDELWPALKPSNG